MNSEDSGLILMQGNEACARGALAAGLTFYAGYPITPSTEIMQYLAGTLPLRGGKFLQMEDEIAGIAAALGASLAGAKAMTATSGPGFSLMQENIGYGIIAEIPLVIVNVQRLGPSTGGPTCTGQGDVMQSKWGSHGDYETIVLTPSTVEECFSLTVKAFDFAERFCLPVILLLEEVTGHLREAVRAGKIKDTKIADRNLPAGSDKANEKYRPYRTEKFTAPSSISLGKGYRYHVTGLYHDSGGFPATGNRAEVEKLRKRQKNKILSQLSDITLYEEYFTKDAEILIIAYGSSVRPSLAAIKEARKNSIKAGMVALKTLWPFPYSMIEKVIEGRKKIVVPEHNFGQISGEISKSVNKVSRLISLQQIDGSTIKPEKITAYLRG